jgi:ABC-type Fe3+-siderophore transport system permease subunit
MPSRRRVILVLALLSLLALASLRAALSTRSIRFGSAEVAAALVGHDPPGADVILQLRLPRALAGFACGGLLALAGALMQVLLAIAPEDRLRGMLFWLMGDLAQTVSPWPPLALLAATLVVAMPFARQLNLLARGLLQAQALGVAVDRLRHTVYLLAALATAAAVTSAGAIGFVGLVVPHLLRLTSGNDHRLLLPAAALAGGSLLLLADTLARTLIAPQQLPVGVLTALIGVPVFLFLLSRQPK